MSDRSALLEEFDRAWRARDIEALMDLMAPEPEFRCSTGPEPGARFTGTEDVRRGFLLFLGPPGVAAAQSESAGHLVCEQFAVTRWTARSTQADGTVVEARTCDVFEFEGDRIKVKDTYRKVDGALPTR